MEFRTMEFRGRIQAGELLARRLTPMLGVQM
jgi:hypothetical protein